MSLKSDPNHIYLPIPFGCNDESDNIRLLGVGSVVQRLNFKVQYNSSSVQTDVPQLHPLELADAPNFLVHVLSTRDRATQVLPVLSYPLLQDVQILAPLEVQAAPVAAAPFVQEQEFDVQTRFDEDEQAVVSLVPVPQADRHPEQLLPVL